MSNNKKKPVNEPKTDLLVPDPEMVPVTNEELLALHTAQGNIIASQQEEIEKLVAKLAELSAQKPVSDKATAGTATVQAGAYRIVHGVFVDGALKSPADIAADPSLIERLVAERSSAIQPN